MIPHDRKKTISAEALVEVLWGIDFLRSVFFLQLY